MPEVGHALEVVGVRRHQVADDDHSRTCVKGGSDAGLGVLEHDTVARLDPQQFRGAQVAVRVRLPVVDLAGRHQHGNAATAIAALRTAFPDLPPAAYEAGIARADWPARLQPLKRGHLPALLPDGSPAENSVSATLKARGQIIEADDLALPTQRTRAAITSNDPEDDDL